MIGAGEGTCFWLMSDSLAHQAHSPKEGPERPRGPPPFPFCCATSLALLRSPWRRGARPTTGSLGRCGLALGDPRVPRLVVVDAKSWGHTRRRGLGVAGGGRAGGPETTLAQPGPDGISGCKPPHVVSAGTQRSSFSCRAYHLEFNHLFSPPHLGAGELFP